MTVERKSRRPEVAQRKKFYGTARWKRLRAKVLANNPICSVCHAVAATAVDHVEHRDDNSSFWDIHNLRPICKSCNSSLSVKANTERRRNGYGHRSDAWGGYGRSANGELSTTRGANERHTATENDRVTEIFNRYKRGV